MKVKVVRTKDVPLPRYGHEGDAGMDLHATEVAPNGHTYRYMTVEEIRDMKTGD